MKYCQKCGTQVHDEAVICTGCGCSLTGDIHPSAFDPTKEIREASGMANSAIIFAFLVPVVGLILGIIGCAKYKTSKFKSKCIGAILISIGMWIVSFALLASMG